MGGHEFPGNSIGHAPITRQSRPVRFLRKGRDGRRPAGRGALSTRAVRFRLDLSTAIDDPAECFGLSDEQPFLDHLRVVGG